MKHNHYIFLFFYDRKLKGLEVRVGATELVGVGERITVQEIIVHPDYDFENFDNDITLLRVNPISV